MNDSKVMLGMKVGVGAGYLLKSMRLCSRVQLVMYRSDQRKNGKCRLLVFYKSSTLINLDV